MKYGGYLIVGALLEIVVFFSALPKHSMDKVTPWQTLAGYLLTPGGLTFGLLGTTFGHALDRAPIPLAAVGVVLVFGIPFVTQAAVFALPVYLVRMAIRSRKSKNSPLHAG